MQQEGPINELFNQLEK